MWGEGDCEAPGGHDAGGDSLTGRARSVRLPVDVVDERAFETPNSCTKDFVGDRTAGGSSPLGCDQSLTFTVCDSRRGRPALENLGGLEAERIGASGLGPPPPRMRRFRTTTSLW